MDRATIEAHRLERQGLVRPARDEPEYLELVGRLQPIAPVANSRPGSPPRLVHRTTFDDGDLADQMRGRRELVKGRFWAGKIGYVMARDLELYGAAFQRPLARFNQEQEAVFEALRYGGELTPRQLKEETGLLNKRIMPALHRLQQAFLVFEDQADSNWERPWMLMEAAWPEVDLERRSRDEAVAEVVQRFLRGQVFATLAQLQDWSGFALKLLRETMARLEQTKTVVRTGIEGWGEGWLLAAGATLEKREPARAVYMLHRADPLVRPHITELKQRFQGREVLQYLLIDGDLAGAVCGHWRIGPHDVDDVVVDLPPSERKSRKDEILTAVSLHYRPPESRIVRYHGQVL